MISGSTFCRVNHPTLWTWPPPNKVNLSICRTSAHRATIMEHILDIAWTKPRKFCIGPGSEVLSPYSLDHLDPLMDSSHTQTLTGFPEVDCFPCATHQYFLVFAMERRYAGNGKASQVLNFSFHGIIQISMLHDTNRIDPRIHDKRSGNDCNPGHGNPHS